MRPMPPASVHASYIRDAAYRDEAASAEYSRRRVARLVLPLLAGAGVFFALVPWGAVGLVFGAPPASAALWTLGGLFLVAVASLGTWRTVARLTARAFNLEGVRADWRFSAGRVVYDLGQGAQQHSSSEWKLYTLVARGPWGLRLHRAPAIAYLVPARAFDSPGAMAQVMEWARAEGVKTIEEKPHPGWALAGAWSLAALLLLTVMTWICLAAAVEVTGARRVVALFTSGTMTFLPVAAVAAFAVLLLHWLAARTGLDSAGVHALLGGGWGAGLAFALEWNKAWVLDGPLLSADLLSAVPLTLGVLLGALSGALVREFWTAGLKAHHPGTVRPPAPSPSAR